jgi:hypothetical protein
VEQSSGNIYELIGRLVVAFVRRRYGRQIRTAAIGGVALASMAAVGVYLATRDESQNA